MKCTNCQAVFLTSWSNQKSQYGKIRRRGYSHEEARQVVSFCPKCLNDWLKDHPKRASVAGVATYPFKHA